MFARIKPVGKYKYLQIVQNYREDKKTKQRVICTLGNLKDVESNNEIERIARSLTKYSEKTLMLLSDMSNIKAHGKIIGSPLVFDRLWNEVGIKGILKNLLKDRKYEFDVERAVFLTVLHRLLVSGSDRSCDRWRLNYLVEGNESLSLHQFYRAMAFLGEPLHDQHGKTPFTPRCTKDIIEEGLFARRRNLFTGLDLLFFDTTSIYFEGEGGTDIGAHGHSKDHRPDLKQMVVGAILDNHGTPVCCEMWPGNTSDVSTLLPIVKRLQDKFGVEFSNLCIVADRGMISDDIIKNLEKNNIKYILGTRMRKTGYVKNEVLSHTGKYNEIYPESPDSKDPSPLKVKEIVSPNGIYVVCINEKQARKDALDREAIVQSLQEHIKHGAKSFVGNKGYRKYLKINKNSVKIDKEKIKEEARYDGKWVLISNTGFSAEQVALKYKELWQVEQVFREMKSVLETRPIYHKTDEAIRGHVFCSFLALVLKKELTRRLDMKFYNFEWEHIKQDLNALEEVEIEDNGRKLTIRTECQGVCAQVFQSVGMALPPTIREL